MFRALHTLLSWSDHKMEKFVLLIVLISTCYAEPEDLSGKVFVFPKETNTDHIKLLTDKTQFTSVTVCLRFITDLTRTYSLFSLATSSTSNDFLLFKQSGDVFRMIVQDTTADFLSMSYPANTWHSMCGTWNTDNGIGQLWLDGKPTIMRYVKSGSQIAGKPITILGQEQDNYGGGFDAAQSFVGMISDVHMWDNVLSTTEIKRYMNHKYFTPGNVFNWRSLEYETIGNILVADDPENV